MAGVESGLSVPTRVTSAPRALSEGEWETLEAAADALIPASGSSPAASAAPDYRHWVNRALGARAEDFALVAEGLAALDDGAGTMWYRLEVMSHAHPEHFRVLSSVIAGAYLMVPEVRTHIGYPGQGGAAPGLSEAADQLEDGILDSVVARGSIYVSAAGE